MAQTEQDANGETLPESNAEQEVNIIQLAAMLFDHIEQQISAADTKAQLTLAADTLLVAALTLSSENIFAGFLDSGLAFSTRLAIWVNLALFVYLIISIYYSILTVRPNLIPPVQSRNLFFFGHIMQFSERDFIETFSGQSEHVTRENLLAQVHKKAIIVNNKFIRMKRSVDFLLAALILWGLLQVVLIFSP